MELRDDEAFLEALAAGDSAHLDAVLRMLLPDLLRLAGRCLPKTLSRRASAEDVVQLAICSFIAQLRRGAYTFACVADVKKLLATITLEKVRGLTRYHRAARRDIRRETVKGSPSEPADWHNDPVDATAAADWFEHFLKGFEFEEQHIIRLRAESHTIEEIAVIVGRSHRFVDKVLADARTRLQDMCRRAV